MDFHSLTRRELQALCKKNSIPANMTNVAMADALTARHPNVQGMEEISGCSKSVSVQSSVESPERTEVTSPRVPRTRTTRKKVESATVVNKTTTTTTRRLTRNKKDGVAPINIDVQFSEVDNQSEIGKGKEASIPQTPSMVSDTRKRSSQAEITTTKAYSTRRSTRLAAKTSGHTDTSVVDKEKPDAANMKLFSADCGDNFEMNDNESCADLSTGDDINEVANIENKDEIIGENGNDSNEQAVVDMMDEVAENNGESYEEGDKLNGNGEIVTAGVEVCGVDINPNDDNDDGNLVSQMMDMSLTSKDGVIEDYDGGILVPKVNDCMLLADNGGMLAETENHGVSDAIVVDEFVALSEEEHVLVKVAAAEQVDKIDCDEPSQEYSKVDELLPKSEVEDLVNGDMLAETENHDVSDAVNECVPMSEEEEHALVKVAAVEQVDKIDCDEPSQEYSKEDELLPKSEVDDLVNGGLLVETENHAVTDAIVVDESVPMVEEEERFLVKDAAEEPSQEYSKEDDLLPKSGVEDLVNVAAGGQLDRAVEFIFDSMSSDEEKEEDVVNVAVGKQLVNGESGKPSQKNSKDDEFSPKSFSMEESSEEEGSEEDESEEGSEEDESEEGSEEHESEDESEEVSEDESEEVDLVFNVAVGGQLVNCDSEKPSELISKEGLPKSFLMEEEYKEEEGSEDELEEVEDPIKVAGGVQLDNKPSENSEKDAISKAILMEEEYKEEEGSEDELEEVEDAVKVTGGAQLDKKASENSEIDGSSKASIFVDDTEGILPLAAMTAVPTPGKKNPNAVMAGKENLDQMSMRQIRKMIKNLNINDDSKNNKKDTLVKKSDEEMVETASKRTALQMLPENQH